MQIRERVMKSTFKYRNRLIKLAILPFLIVNSAVLQGQENDNNPVELTPCYMEGLSDRLMCGSIARPLSDNPASKAKISSRLFNSYLIIIFTAFSK